MTIEKSFLLDIRAELSSLYTCDTSRYVESSSNWTFDEVEAGDLLYALGVRDGDQNARSRDSAQERPGATNSTTSVYSIDSVDSGYEAYVALYGAEGVKLTVERSGAPSGKLVIWITIDP